MSAIIIDKIQTRPFTDADSTCYIRAIISCDTAADLPVPTYFTGYTLEQASEARVIADNSKYEMQSDGTWVLQTAGGSVDTYTRAEIDAMIASLQEEIYLYHHITTISGVDSITFISVDIPLQSYSISGNLEQAGTPTPSDPIYPTECGDLVEDGDHAGEYEFPITCNETTEIMYLTEPLLKIGDYADTISSTGTVTRAIKKLVFTGTENIDTVTVGSSDLFRFAITYTGDKMRAAANETMICNSYAIASTRTECGETNNTMITYNATTDMRIIVHDDACATVDAFKQFLTDQYAAGTPVCVWYVLATAQTETFTAQTITPTSGSNTFSVGTSLPPSAFSITGNIKTP